MKKRVFITGIGTNIGKSYATGWLANKLITDGEKVMTLKMIQTGDVGYSEDIDLHRKIMGIPYTDDDKNFVTAPIIMSYPASPHLAAKLDNCNIDLSKIDKSLEILETKYETILIEVAGGLMVPITEDYLTIDYIKDKDYPVCLVTNGYLGSINHTLLSLESLENRGIELKYLIYNTFFDDDKIIAEETQKYLRKYVNAHFPHAEFYVMPKIK